MGGPVSHIPQNRAIRRRITRQRYRKKPTPRWTSGLGVLPRDLTADARHEADLMAQLARASTGPCSSMPKSRSCRYFTDSRTATRPSC